MNETKIEGKWHGGAPFVKEYNVRAVLIFRNDENEG